MDVFRLMAMPDKVLAIEGLPESLLEGFEMSRADGFPRHWKAWMGMKKKITKLPPERDALTGQIRRFEPIIEEDSYFYWVDWNLGPVTEKWSAVCDYIRQNVKRGFSLKEKIEDMARPLAPNKSDGVMLEPEEVIIIPLTTVDVEQPKEAELYLCDEEGCKSEFDKERALRMHKMVKHKKETVSA